MGRSEFPRDEANFLHDLLDSVHVRDILDGPKEVDGITGREISRVNVAASYMTEQYKARYPNPRPEESFEEWKDRKKRLKRNPPRLAAETDEDFEKRMARLGNVRQDTLCVDVANLVQIMINWVRNHRRSKPVKIAPIPNPNVKKRSKTAFNAFQGENEKGDQPIGQFNKECAIKFSQLPDEEKARLQSIADSANLTKDSGNVSTPEEMFQ